MENVNSVCFIAKIVEINPIIGADNIELALLNGWNCVVKKDTHKTGDLVVCAITDAMIPNSLSEELGVTNYLRKGERVRTVKLRGVYSECLIIPLSFTQKYTGDTTFEGKDMMSVLGVTKYEPPVKMVRLSNGKIKKYSENPNFSIYYKFPNFKNVPNIFDESDMVEITRKIHGTNARYGFVKRHKKSLWNKIKHFFGLLKLWDDYEFVVGSHNVEKGSDTQGFYDKNVWFDIEKKYDIKKKLIDFVKTLSPDDVMNGISIYGEIYGAGIQVNYDYGLNDVEFKVFDIKIDADYSETGSSKKICEQIGLPYIDVLYVGKWNKTIQDSFVLNNFIEGTKIPHEGIVVKSVTGARNKVAKVINPDYLIYGEKNNVGDSH
jgi:RNA ligase (TIGR02306 family)